MKIAILEHFTSAPGPAPGSGTNLRIEGGAMRDAVVADLLEVPGVSLTVLHRPDCPVRPVPARLRGRGGVASRGRARGVPVTGPREAAFRAAVRRSEAALVIAPETEGILEALASIVEEEGRLLLGPSSRAIRLAADKLRTAKCLAAAGIPAPRTAPIEFDSARRRLREWTPPYILKPRDGCGGSGVVLVRSTGGIERALAALRRATARADFLAQEFVEGDDASVSLLAGGAGRIVPIGVNRQRIEHTVPFRYLGGETSGTDRAGGVADLARRAVAALSAATGGARGYLGVDLVIGAAGPRVIEINPRLTTSYIGLRHVVEANPAALIVDAALGRRLPDPVPGRGACRFEADGRVAAIAGGRRPMDGRDGTWRSTSAGTSAAST